MKPLIILAVFLVLAPMQVYAQTVEEASITVKTPDGLARWLSSEFTFQLKFPDRPQDAEETLRRRSGDCDDFAALASDVLARLGITGEIFILKFGGLSVSHAICAWRDRDGSYCFISNRELFRSHKQDLDEAVKKFFPDCVEMAKAPVARL